MTIEEEIFARSTPNDAAFVPFGFVRGRDGSYRYSEQFLDKQFRADVCIKNGVITGRVFDIASDEEYMPLRVTRHHGAFVNEVRTAYSAVLRRIKEACFIQQPFLSAQANRIARAVNDAYGDAPDFTFPTAPTYAVFRNPQNKRWYGIVMNIARGKLTAKHDAKKSRSSNNGKKQPGGTRHAANTRGDTKAAAANATRAAKKSRNSERQTEGEKIVEILNVKLAPEKSAHLITQKGFFPPYHMNKKNWITIVLDGTVRDSVIMELLAESHAFTEKGSRALSGKKLLSAREAHTWIIPVKPDYYDVEQDFRRDGTIRWHQRVSACVGDTVYMYMSAPVYAVRYKCRVITADCIPSDGRSEVNVPAGTHAASMNSVDTRTTDVRAKVAPHDTPCKEMVLRLEKRYDDDALPRTRLRELGVQSVRSARHLPDAAIRELEGE